MRIIILLLYQVLLSNQIVIDLITTNDIHGVIQDQKAYFMNPQYPPNIVGGAGLYNYMNNLNDENLIVLDGGNFFQGSNLGIKDKGKGIPKNDRKRIFERFYRVDKSRSKQRGGTGLGLAIVKHIMEGHNSKIKLSSKTNIGSEFSFNLKLAKKGKIKKKKISKILPKIWRKPS